MKAGPGAGWSPWARVEELPRLAADVLAETLDGGQAFRWTRLADAATATSPGDATARGAPAWIGQWGDHVVRVRLAATGHVEWSAPNGRAPAAAGAVAQYLGAERDFAGLADRLPWRSDSHLARCIEAFPGLRILRQPFGETLLCFLCSATKQIVQIKQMVALLAARHGDVVPDTSATMGGPFFQLPTWTALARVPELELRKCLLGFRARYIADTARFLAAHPGWLEETEAAPYTEAKARLCSLPGVGEKVADCVLLFGARRLEAFPVDVWILKTLARRYALEGWKPAPLAQFGRVHFGPLAGLAQQYLFAWERRFGR